MRKILVFVLMCLLLTGCNLPKVQGLTSLNLPPQAWIDAPLNNSTLPLEPYQVVFHGSDPGQVTQGEFSVNGQIQSTVSNPDTNGHLIVFQVKWTPPSSGEYTLRARAQNSNNTWSDYAEVHVTVGITTTTPTMTPTASPTPTTTPTIAGTLTFSNNTLPKQVYSGFCSPNQVIFEVSMNPAQQVTSVLLFTRIEDVSSGAKTGWDPGLSMNSQGSGLFNRTVNTGSLNGAGLYSSAYLDYQFVATDAHGAVLARSQVFNDIQLNRCGIIFLPRPIIIITPTNTPQIVK